MKNLKIVGQPQVEDSWLHRFRNFGEDVYVQMRDEYVVSIEEIDSAVDTFYVRDIPDAQVAAAAATLRRILDEHCLEDSVFVLPDDREVCGPTVVLVIDTNFGEGRWEIAASNDTWVVASDTNRSAVEEMWKARGEASGGPSLTIWSAPTPAVTEEDWLAILDTIEVHHGSLACESPLDMLSVYGATPTPSATAALHEYEYDFVQRTKAGFIAIKRHASLAV